MNRTASSPPRPAGKYSSQGAYLAVLAGICAALHIWKLPPALPELQREIGLTLIESGFLLSLVQLAGMTLGLVTGLFAEKIGLRRCVLIGLSLLGVASILGAVFDSKTALLLFRGMEGCGVLMVTLPAPALIRRQVPPSYLSRVMGMWGSYMPIGTVLILLFGSWALSVSNWRVLWLVLAALTFLMWLAVLRRIPRDPSHSAAMAAEKDKSSAWAIIVTTLSSRNVWLVSLCFSVYAAQWIAVIGFLPLLYTAAGIAGATAGLLTAIVAGVNAFGNLGAGRLLHHGVHPKVLLGIGFSVQAVGAFFAFGIDMPTAMKFVAVLLFSSVSGLIPTTLFLLSIQLAPSPRTVSTSVGWMQQWSATGQFVGPPVVAWIATLAGNWEWTWLFTTACALTGIGISAALGRRT